MRVGEGSGVRGLPRGGVVQVGAGREGLAGVGAEAAATAARVDGGAPAGLGRPGPVSELQWLVGKLLGCLAWAAVSYTHLTLPTN